MADTTPEIFENTIMEAVWVESHPECSVCLQPCLHPVQTPCSHIFCFLCLKGFVYRSKKCALCRSEVQLEYFENPIIVKVKSEAAQCSLNSASENYNWFYEGRNGWWEYDDRARTTLEEAFNSESRSCELLISGFTYFVDFEDMVQFRKSHPARRRRIKRDRTGVERKGVAGLKLRNQVTEDDTNNKNNNTCDDTLEKLKLTLENDQPINTKQVERLPSTDNLSSSPVQARRSQTGVSRVERLPSTDHLSSVHQVRRSPTGISRVERLPSTDNLSSSPVQARRSPTGVSGEPINEASSSSQDITNSLSELLDKTL